MKAIIIAAGMGVRLRPLTEELPKCLLPVLGKPILRHTLDAFRACGIHDITVIRGYKADRIDVPGVKYVLNADYENNNVLGSLMTAEAELEGEVVISYSDIVFRASVLETLLRATGDISVIADRDFRPVYVGRVHHPIAEMDKVLVSNGKVTGIGKNHSVDDAYGEFIGLVKLSAAGSALIRRTYHEVLEAGLERPFHCAKTLRKAYLTDMLTELIARGHAIVPVPIEGGWREIDTAEDLEKASQLRLS